MTKKHINNIKRVAVLQFHLEALRPPFYIFTCSLLKYDDCSVYTLNSQNGHAVVKMFEDLYPLVNLQGIR